MRKTHLLNSAKEAMNWLKKQLEPNTQLSTYDKGKSREKIKQFEKVISAYQNSNSFSQQDDKKRADYFDAENQLLQMQNSLEEYESCLKEGMGNGISIFVELRAYHSFINNLLNIEESRAKIKTSLINNGITVIDWLKAESASSNKFSSRDHEEACEKIKQFNRAISTYQNYNSFFQQDDKKRADCLAAENQLLQLQNSLEEYNRCMKDEIIELMNDRDPSVVRTKCYNALKYNLLNI